MYRLLDVAHNAGIVIEHQFLPLPLEALYIREPKAPPIIIMSKDIAENSPQYRSVFAHELGHHFTTANDVISTRFCSYRDRVNASRAEYRANKWAVDFLVPREEFLSAITEGIVSPWDLASYFSVTESVICFRISLLRKEGKYNAHTSPIRSGLNRRTG